MKLWVTALLKWLVMRPQTPSSVKPSLHVKDELLLNRKVLQQEVGWHTWTGNTGEPDVELGHLRRGWAEQLFFLKGKLQSYRAMISFSLKLLSAKLGVMD